MVFNQHPACSSEYCLFNRMVFLGNGKETGVGDLNESTDNDMSIIFGLKKERHKYSGQLWKQ